MFITVIMIKGFNGYYIHIIVRAGHWLKSLVKWSHSTTMVSEDGPNIFIKKTPNCIASMRTVFLISKLFACNLFYLPPDRHSVEPIRMRIIDYVAALLYVILYVVFVIPFFGEMVFVRTHSLLPSGNIVIIYLVRIIFYFILIANCSAYIMETLNRKKIWKLFTTLYDFDEQVRLQKCTPERIRYQFYDSHLTGKEFGNQCSEYECGFGRLYR